MMDFERIRTLSKNKNIAIVLAQGFGALAVIRELGKNHVPIIVISKHEFIIKSCYCLGFRIHTNENIIKFLKEIPKYIKQKPVIMTDEDGYLDLLYKNWDTLLEHYLMPIQVNNQRLTNKLNLYENTYNAGLEAPMIYNNYNNITMYPVLVKPVNGPSHNNPNIKLKAYECVDQIELTNTLQFLKEQNVECIVQQIIHGDVQQIYSVTLYRNSQGKITVGLVTKKIRQFPNNYGIGTIHITCEQPEIVNDSIKLLDAVGFIGVAEIEYKYCKDIDKFLIIEVNGRFPVQISLTHKLGNNFIFNVYLDLISEVLKARDDFKSDHKQAIWIHFLRDLGGTKNKLDLFPFYLYHIFNSRIQGAIWDWSDLKPVLYYYKKVLTKLYNNNKRGRGDCNANDPMEKKLYKNC